MSLWAARLSLCGSAAAIASADFVERGIGGLIEKLDELGEEGEIAADPFDYLDLVEGRFGEFDSARS